MKPPPTRIVWVSGASAGIGRAIVEAVPWKDATIIIGISRRGLGDRTAEHGSSNVWLGLEADLSEPGGWQLVADSFQERISAGVESAIFIHAAATVGPIGFVGELNSLDYQNAVLLNTAAPQVLGDAFLRVVNMAEINAQLLMLTSGMTTYPGWAAYKAGKAAMNAWVQAAGRHQREIAGKCRVLAMAPGYVETAMQQAIRLSDPRDFPNREKFLEA